MGRYRVIASLYDDLLRPSVVRRGNYLDVATETQIHTIECESVDELPILFAKQYGVELEQLRGTLYWYVEIANKWYSLS